MQEEMNYYRRRCEELLLEIISLNKITSKLRNRITGIVSISANEKTK